jgi:hypothetical protein
MISMRTELAHLRAASPLDPARLPAHGIGVIRVIEDQITTLRPYNARYTDDHRQIFRKRHAEMITRVSRQSAPSLGTWQTDC